MFSFSGAKYVVTGNTLHMRDVQPTDALSRYACSTENTLTNERQRSSPVNLEVIGKYASPSLT